MAIEYINSINILPPWQKHRVEHLSTAFTQLYPLAHPFLQMDIVHSMLRMFIKSWSILVATGQPVVFFFHHQSTGSGTSCIAVRASLLVPSLFGVLYEHFLSWWQVFKASGLLCKQIFSAIINIHNITSMIIKQHHKLFQRFHSHITGLSLHQWKLFNTLLISG